MPIKCPKCHFENTDTVRFCGNCATSLTSAKDTPPSLTQTLESPIRVVTPGTVFAGRYEILDSIGAGGMGEVYRALDKSLGRHVAIKILPAAFAEEKERMARFDREAKLLAVLNHPNIAAIHGFEESEGRRFLVLELAEGETLQSRLNRGALPVDDTLEICRQLADGLEAAHEKGIVHRDLKPGNIMISPEGKVKILDFGLAKAYSGETSVVDIEKSPTITALMTEPGVILGTAAYMSPEQARSRPIDKRTDIWAFGCVLYECLTGSRAFRGETVSDTLAHILKGEPDWRALPNDTSVALRTVLRRCLQKDATRRLRDVGDVRLELQEASDDISSVSTAPRKARLVPLRSLVVAVSLAFLLGLAFVLAIWKGWPGRLQTRDFDSTVRYTIDFQSGQRLYTLGFAPPLILSPDGVNVVYAVAEKGRSQLFLRARDQFDPKPIPSTEGAAGPFFSPDGQSVGFFAAGRIKSVPIGGGIVQDICEAAGFPAGACWCESDNIIFASDISGLMVVSARGGTPKPLTKPDVNNGEIGHIWPHALPGGKGILFSIMTEEAKRLAVLSLKTGKWETLIRAGGEGFYLPSGELLYQESNALLVAPFDQAHLRLSGKASSALQGLATTQVAGEDWAFYAVSPTGTLAYMRGAPRQESATLVWVDRHGQVTPVPLEPALSYGYPRISPDGRRVAVNSSNAQIWIYELETGRRMRLTQGGINYCPVWSPDGRRIAYATYREGFVNIFWKSADDGGGPESIFVNRDERKYPASWTPDGRTLIYNTQNPKSGGDIWSLSPEGSPIPLHNARFQEGLARLSPDGSWLAYASDESGRSEVYVQPYPGPGKIEPVSKDGGDEPVWAHNGRELFYRNGAKMMAVDIVTHPKFSAGNPRMIFEGPYARRGMSLAASYDISLDDRRFLMINSDVQAEGLLQIHVIVNWFEELKRLAPTDRE